MEIPEKKLHEILRSFEIKKDEIIRGIGDDCAVVQLKNKLYALCQDALVEEIHFSFSFMNPSDVGKKALYVNIADVLAMGARPLFYQVTLGIPKRINSKVIKGIYRGMNAVSKEFDVSLVGGDLVATKNDFFIDVSMVGELVCKNYKGRNSAREGDFIGVTGRLGESAYGLKILKEGRNLRRYREFVKRYRNPRPPYEVWRELIKNDITNAMMDISDGLLLDLERMMEESKKCAVIYYEKLPIPEILKKERLEEYALSGGEDYQFLFTFSKDKMDAVEDLMKKGFDLSIIGEVVSGCGVRVLKEGKPIFFKKKGYDHFLGEK